VRIVAVERRPRRRLLTITFDDGSTLDASLDTVVTFGVGPGGDLSPERIKALADAEMRHQANAAALRMLARTALSETELRRKLAQRGTPPGVIAEITSRLRRAGLINDEAFATGYAERRDRSSPRGRRLIAAELRAKGVARDVASASTEPLDDLDAAARAGSRRASTMKDLPYAEFRRKLGDFLLRRGFEYETADATVSRLWSDLRAGREP
jgi:regulatory protein